MIIEDTFHSSADMRKLHKLQNRIYLTSVDLCSSHSHEIYKLDLKHLIQYVIISAVWNLEDSETEKEMDALRKAKKRE